MTHVLIVGAGIAGPVAALALRRAGISAEMHEGHRTGGTDAGAFLTLAGNGMAALRTLGADGPVAAAGFPTERMQFASGTGRRLGTVPLGPGSITVTRSELHDILRDQALDAGVPTHYDHRLTGVRRSTRGVTAEFADGSTATGDLLVGADGLRSVTRTLLDPRTPPARYVPVLNTGGFAPDLPDVPGEPGVYTMVFGRRAFFSWVRHPDGAIWWFANPPRRDEPAPGELATIGDAAWRSHLTGLLAGDAGPAVRIIDATPGQLSAWATYDLPTVPVWQADRVVLVGDAAHATAPSSGQGASMAIEDAVVLAKCLRDLPDPDRALSAYEQLRRRRVEKVVKHGRRSSSGKAVGGAARVLRDLMLPPILRHVAASAPRSLAWLNDYDIDWESPVSRDLAAAR